MNLHCSYILNNLSRILVRNTLRILSGSRKGMQMMPDNSPRMNLQLDLHMGTLHAVQRHANHQRNSVNAVTIEVTLLDLPPCKKRCNGITIVYSTAGSKA